MRIFGMGIPELLIIVLIICVLFGPMLFKKINGQVKKTGSAAKKAVENGAKAAGTDADLGSIDKSVILDKVESFQDRVDKMFADAEEDDGDSDADADEDGGSDSDEAQSAPSEKTAQ